MKDSLIQWFIDRELELELELLKLKEDIRDIINYSDTSTESLWAIEMLIGIKEYDKDLIDNKEVNDLLERRLKDE